MPRYHFHVFDGQVTLDQDGTELDGTDKVYRQAITAAGEILANGEGFEMMSGYSWNMIVTDESGRTVMALRFKAEMYGLG
jgi:hypothetical protein